MNRNDLIRTTAKEAHAKLCNGYKERGKPYIQETKDEAWIQAHGTNRVDLCDAELDTLPQDWLKERLAGAEIAVDAVLKANDSGRPLDAELVEEVAELLHRRWLERNATQASDIQKFDYAGLPEVEKEKDRHFITSAIEVFSSKV